MKDYLEYLNHIKIDLDEYVEYSLNDIEKQKMKKNFINSIGKRKKNNIGKLSIKISGIAIVLILGVIGFSKCFPTYAEKIPGLKEVIKFLNRNNEIDGYEEVSTPIMSNEKSDGYDLNIESVYYNGKELTIFYNIIGEEKLNQNTQYLFEAKLDLEFPATYEYSLEYVEFIDEYTFAGIVSIYITPHDGNVLPQVLNCKIDFTKLYTDYSMENFVELKKEPIELSLDSSSIDIKEYEINKEIVFNDNSINVIKAQEYPTGIFIETKNNTVNFDESISYILWDSNKGELRGIAGRNGEDGAISSQYRLPGENSEVYLIPYVYI